MAFMSTLEERLSSASAAVREHSLAQRRLQELQRRIDELSHKAEQQRGEHRSEQDDVDRLEGISLTSVFAAVSGSRDDKLARERAEVDAAHLRLRHTEAELEVLRRDHARQQLRVTDLEQAPQHLADVLNEKETLLREVGDPRADRLFGLAEEDGRLRGEVPELNEAVEAALAASAALREAAMSLDSASSWSSYDTFFGGGRIASSIKHSRLDDAAEATARADQRLALLRTELSDVSAGTTSHTLYIDGRTRTFDIWLDNIYADLAVHDRIKKSQQAVARAAASVSEIMAGLAEHARKTRERLSQIDAERHRILTEPSP
jgi:hypothetical protein